jgi:glycosyltransferase involved in cell wall biosynthesis
MTVSVAMIVRNEERTIGRCLESIRDHVDEIVVVDTGSQDRTKEVAAAFTEHVHDLPWPGHFAQARQFSFQHAKGDWVFWIDADDVVIGANHIRDELASAPPAVDGFCWRYAFARDVHGNVTAELWRERCVRNNGTFHWEGRVHEVLVSPQPAVMRNSDSVQVHHCRDPERDVDPRRNLMLLEEEYLLQAEPEPRLLLYLGNEHADLGEGDLAIDFLQRYVGASTWKEEKYFALLRIADLFRRKGLYDLARDTGNKAAALLPQWPLAYFSLAETAYFLKDWRRLVTWVGLGRRLPPPDTVCCFSRLDLNYRWIISYANALYQLGQVEEALSWTQAALTICPDDASHLANCAFLLRELRQTQ